MSAPHSLSCLLDEYLRHVPNLAPGTIEQYRIAVRHAERQLGPIPPSQLRAAHLSELQRQLASSRSPATVNKIMRHLMAVLRFGVGCGWLHHLGIRPLREPRRLPVVWSLDELAQLWRAASAMPGQIGGLPASLCWRLALSLLWDTGCRIGELVRARVSDVWPDRRTWIVPAEHRKGRTCDRLYILHAETAKLIAESLAVPRTQLVPLPMSRKSLYGRFNALLAAASLPSDRQHKFHCLRRTAETYAAANRGIAWAAEAIGHSIGVARRFYVHPQIAGTPSLVDALPRPWAS